MQGPFLEETLFSFVGNKADGPVCVWEEEREQEGAKGGEQRGQSSSPAGRRQQRAAARAQQRHPVAAAAQGACPQSDRQAEVAGRGAGAA